MGQYIEDSAPKELAPAPFAREVFINHRKLAVSGDSEVIIEKAEGLLLLGDLKNFTEGGIGGVSGTQIQGLKLPGPIEVLRNRIDPIYLGQPLTMNKIYEIRAALNLFYRDYNAPVVLALVPEQTITNNVFQMVVIETRIDSIAVRGNKWFSDKEVMSNISLQKGGPVNASTVAQDLDWINRNPFRQSDVILRPGALEGTTDVEFWTYDRIPFRPYVGVENTGYDVTGRGRLLAGFNWGDAWKEGHLLSYQYTTSLDFGRFYAHTFDYTVPIKRLRHLWELFGGYSRVRPKMPFFGVDNVGTNSQLSTRYIIPIPRQRKLLQEVRCGIDFKKTNNTLLSSDIIIFGGKAVITQAVIGYHLNYKEDIFRCSFDTEVFWSPGDLFAYQSNKDYQTLRPKAKSNYIYWTYSFIPIIELPNKWTFAFTQRAQLANRNLLGPEQFGIGGYNTVRGYDMRDVNSDNALTASGELRTPPMRIVSAMKNIDIDEELRLIWFLDYGIGWNHQRINGEKASIYLLGIGPGLRYHIGTNLTAYLDWGIKLRDVSFLGDTSWSRVHFSVLISY